MKMTNSFLFVSIILSLSKLSSQIQSSKQNSHYIGAVVEYHPITDGDDGQIIAEANVNNYRTIIKTAASYSVDIIVFPEFGLTSMPSVGPRGKPFDSSEYRSFYRNTASLLPAPSANVTLCDATVSYSEALKRISCAAREFNMYVVVNHHERVECPSRDCSPDGFLLYNTNVVFDRKGRLIARYRKYNLLEIGTNATREPDISTFSTDFGVTFGQLVCLDILKERPATYFARQPNVTDIVFSSRLFDEPPFLGSLQEHAAWAYAADVNLLAASYNGDFKGSGGSGIYAGRRGPIRVYHPGVPANAVIVAEIPKMSRRSRAESVRSGASSIHVFKQAEVPTIPSSSSATPPSARNNSIEDLSEYTSLLLDPKDSSHITTLCDRGLCCEFHVETSFDEDLAKREGSVYYRYRLVVFNGVRQLTTETTIGLEVCALVSCAGEELEQCGRRYSDTARLVEPTVFDMLIVTRKADLKTRSFYMPTTATSDHLPINSTDFGFVIGGPKNNSLILAYLARPNREIATFGIYGRRFDRDGEPATKASSVGSVVPSVGLLLLVAIALKLCID